MKLLRVCFFLFLSSLTLYAQEQANKDSLSLGQEITAQRNNGQTLYAKDIDTSLEEYFINALNAKTTGIIITSASGSPGASASIRIRGNRSILEKWSKSN